MNSFRKLSARERSQAAKLTWFILKAAPRREYRVQKILSDLGVTAFVPSEWRWRKKSRYQKSPTKTDYPAYKSVVFVGQGDAVLPWYKFERVSAILGCYMNPVTGFPSVISTSDIQQVMAAARTPLFELHNVPEEKGRFQAGDSVRITDGLLFGEVMTIADMADGMAVFYREMLGKAVPVKVSPDDLKFEARAA